MILIPKKTILLVIFFSLFCAETVQSKMISVNGDKVNMRKGPGVKYEVLWEYGNGFPLKVVSKKGSWVRVKDFEGDTGWIHDSLLRYDPRVIVKVNRSRDKKINIRSGPGTSNEIVGKAHYGVVFKSKNKKSGWIKVEHESGLIGWVKGNLLWGY